jgi:FixJ family two-component response regulator
MGVLADDGLQAEAYADGESFLAAYRNGVEGCLLVDAYMPGMSGIDLLERLRRDGHSLPALMITGQSDVHMAVTAMKAGALDFIEKPVGRVELLASIARALAQSHDTKQLADWRAEAARRVAELTPRQRQIMTCVLAGQPADSGKPSRGGDAQDGGDLDARFGAASTRRQRGKLRRALPAPPAASIFLWRDSGTKFHRKAE